jgi:hypothetical protein
MWCKINRYTYSFVKVLNNINSTFIGDCNISMHNMSVSTYTRWYICLNVPTNFDWVVNDFLYILKLSLRFCLVWLGVYTSFYFILSHAYFVVIHKVPQVGVNTPNKEWTHAKKTMVISWVKVLLLDRWWGLVMKGSVFFRNFLNAA